MSKPQSICVVIKKFTLTVKVTSGASPEARNATWAGIMGDTHLASVRQIEQLAAQDFHSKVVDIFVLYGVRERPEISMVYSPKAICEHLRIDLKELISGVVYLGDLRIEYVTVFIFWHS